jgi:hypothetical protein
MRKQMHYEVFLQNIKKRPFETGEDNININLQAAD